MQFVSFNWQSLHSNQLGGNQLEAYGLPGYISVLESVSHLVRKTLAQTIFKMKNPRKQNNGNAVGTVVRTGIPLIAETDNDCALPRFPEQHLSESPSPREIPLPEEESFRTFLSSRLPKHKATQALRDKVRSTIEKNETF